MPVAVVVDERATRIPARAIARHARPLADIGEGSVAIVVIENVLAEVRDEQIVPAIVVIVADADALSPARMRDSSLQSHVGESSVAIVAEKMRSWFVAGGEALKARSVHQKYIEPAIVVVVVEGNAASSSLEQIFILVLAAVDGLGIQAGLACNVEEGDSQVAARCRLLFRRTSFLQWWRTRAQPARASQREHAFERKHQGRTAERFQKTAP